MNALSRSNLQEFCRTCLTNLQKADASIPDASMAFSPVRSYNINLLPKLHKLIMLFMSLDVSDEEESVYPKRLCELCYEKINDFREFQSLAKNSTKVLYEIVTGINNGLITTNSTDAGENNAAIINKMEQTTEDVSNDPLYLVPGTPQGSIIKVEPDEVVESLSHLPALPTIHNIDHQVDNSSNKSDEALVKNEVNSDFEENYSTFYEDNALHSNYNSVSDDADDEEHALRNGAANTSCFNPTSTKGRQRNTVLSSKRDRNKKSLKCPRCDKQVYKKVYLDAHIRGVHEGHEKPFLCVDCDKAFTRYNQLHLHIQSQHLIAQKFVCGFNGCDAEFKMNATLETHRKVVHTSLNSQFPFGLDDVLELHQAQLNEELEMEHFCTQCSRKYSSKRALSEHLKRHANIKEYKCKECGAAKVTRTELQIHMRIHAPDAEKFKCSICPQEFKHKNAVSRHVRVVHEGERRYPCSFCPKRFGTRHSKVCHERIHTGEEPYNCKRCDKSFKQLEGLKSHMRSHDKNLRRYICSFCSLRFLTKRNLIHHEQRHRSNKPHICMLCTRGFAMAKDLQAHCKSHVDYGEDVPQLSDNDESSDNMGVNVGKQAIPTIKDDGADMESEGNRYNNSN